jgi:GTP-binding protein HflX
VQGLKASQLRRLERLHVRNATGNSVCPPEVARALADAASDTGRMVGVLCDRKGSVTDVILGESTRLYLPDIGRLRAGPGRLRGLRLLVSKPVRESQRGPLHVDHDLVTDLIQLKLDCVLVIEATHEGLPGRAALAHILPGAHFDAAGKVSEGHALQHFHHVNEIDLPYQSFIDELEGELARNVEDARAAAVIPGERDTALLIGAYALSQSGQTKSEALASLDELRELARTAGVRVVDEVVQMRHELDPRTVVGSGKLEEICLLALHRGAELLIFDCDLTPSQLNAITDVTDLKIIDRTMLILDIFARRAKSRGGRMQVELAQLRYSLPRLAKKQTGLSRLTGGIGGQGPGETKLEIDKRRAKEKLTRLEREIERFSTERQLRRRRRNERAVPTIAIVGYTNAGKSTLLNTLTGADVYAANELFATLDPTSRRLRFPHEREVVLIDTVGFIRDLPATLVNAFRATLEELHDADLLLHVVDGSDPRRDKHIEAVERVLEDLGLAHTPRLLVLNKSDVAKVPEGDGEALRLKAVRVSAKSASGLPDLVNRMAEELWQEAALLHRETWAPLPGEVITDDVDDDTHAIVAGDDVTTHTGYRGNSHA